MSSSKLIVLRSSDGEMFEVNANVLKISQTIKHMIDDDCADSVIPLPNITGNILSKVIEYCKKHEETPTPTADDDKVSEKEQKDFDKEFVNVDRETLFKLVLAANFLDIKNLLDLTCQTAADSIKDKSVEEVRKIFNIENDFTPEEEKAVRDENAWAFE